MLNLDITDGCLATAMFLPNYASLQVEIFLAGFVPEPSNISAARAFSSNKYTYNKENVLCSVPNT